jgi:hypothetical protein
MIAALALASIVYTDVPGDVTGIAVYRWHAGSAPIVLETAVTRDGPRVTITVAPSADAVVELRRRDDYLLDGPMTLTSGSVERRLDHVWRRTVRGVMDVPGTAIEWLPAGGTGGEPWPTCWSVERKWECLGVPLGAAGVVLAVEAGRVWSAVITGPLSPALRPSAWGRLVIVRDRIQGAPSSLKMAAARPVPSRQRSRAVRVETASVTDVRVTAVDVSAMWVAGDSSPPSAWLEVRSAGAGPAYLPLAEVAEGPPQVPLHILLEETRAIDAAVVSERGEPAASALVTVFRVIDPAPARNPERDQPPPRRVFTAEGIADGDGRVRVDGIGDAEYEIVAWHPQLGRVSLPVPVDAGRVTLRLQSPGVARGRVLVEGKPGAGVDVIAVPDPAAYMTAEDPIDLKGGDARTGPDGRFVVTLAPGGGGELRVGGGNHPVRRVPLPRAPLPLVELGDIELGRAVVLSIALDQDPGCDLRATGPIGRAGLRIVTATRTAPGVFSIALPEEGSWEFGLLCGADERGLAPAVVRVSDQMETVTFVVKF